MHKLISILPKPRRKYELDESSWLVVKGRSFLHWLNADGRTHFHRFEAHARASLGRATARSLSLGKQFLGRSGAGAQATGAWIRAHLGTFSAKARFNMRRTRLAFRWNRVPKVWEIAFIDRMNAAAEMGIPFWEILRETLPGIMGVDGTRALGYWTGKQSMLDPETFVLEMAKLFGKSSQQVVMGVFDSFDEGRMLADKVPEEPKIQSLVDAINLADERKAMLNEMRRSRTTAIVPMSETREPEPSG